MIEDGIPTPETPRPGSSLLSGPHTIEIDLADAGTMGDFLEALAFILRARRRVRITIE
jgi:hypothetical protein